MRQTPKRIGLAIVGAGRVGLFRGEVAARHPMVDFIGLADLKEDRLELVQKKTRADSFPCEFTSWTEYFFTKWLFCILGSMPRRFRTQ